MKVSIVMATYNASEYLAEQLNSILSQSFTNFELIIVDDRSIDETIEIINSYKDSRIKLYQNKVNIGCTRNFEAALNYVTGEYVILCDHDDIWHEGRIQLFIDNIGESDLIYSNCEVIDGDGVVISDSYKKINHLIGLDSKDIDFKGVVMFNSFILGCSMMFRVKWVDVVTPIIDDSWNHDKWIIFIISQLGIVKYFDEVTFKYRIHGANASIVVNKLSYLEKLINELFSKPKSQTFTQDSLNTLWYSRKLTSPDLKELLDVIKRGKLPFLLKYHQFMFLRVSGIKRFRILVNWFLNRNFEN